ncbi:protein of unknown function [Moritella yayanosii]|uniref:Uncharacterized protein n=1 Tax=Moritella yayanosii TaxID=69539 RepID=A0A330LTQ2_9GAMM|nr:protein of unknown function [Moritella yayanosii]
MLIKITYTSYEITFYHEIIDTNYSPYKINYDDYKNHPLKKAITFVIAFD